jgi:hypothetical protein
MDQQTMDVVKDVVKDLSQNGKTFSAFDVTKVLRNEKGLQVFHSEVRKVVHDMSTGMELPVDYIRSNVVLSNGKDAIVYHPQSADISQYDEKAIGAQSSPFAQSQPQATAPNPVPPMPMVTTKAKQNGRDARGRFCISNKLTKQVGLISFGHVTVYADNSRVVVMKRGNCGMFPVGVKFHSLIVDKDVNIRLSPGILKEAGLVNCNLEAEVVSGRIEVFAE